MSASRGSSSLLADASNNMASNGFHSTLTSAAPSPFRDPNFNARQWINAALPASLIASTSTGSGSGIGGGGSAVEKKAAELITHLQLRSQEVTSNLDDAITQTLVRMPRAVAEVSRMSTEAKRLRGKVTEIRADVSSTFAQSDVATPKEGAVEGGTTGTTSTHDAQEVQRLQSTKEKLVWCRSVLKTAQTLSTELRELEGALEALGKHGGSGGGSDQGMGDIEHIANLTRNLNGNLHQLQAVDSSFGQHYAQRIAASEKNLQRMVEQEILETVRHSGSLRDLDVADTDKILLEIGCLQQQHQQPSSGGKQHSSSKSSVQLLGVGPTSLLSLDTPSILQHARKAAEGLVSLSFHNKVDRSNTKSSSGGVGADVGRTAKLLSILRAIDRDEVVIDAFVNSGVDSLVSKFQSVVMEPLASSTSSPPQLSALLMRFYFHLGVTVANEVKYLSRLYLASLLSGRATGLQNSASIGSDNVSSSSAGQSAAPPSSLPQVIGGGGVGVGGGKKTSISELEAVVMDAVSLMARTVIDKIAHPLKDILRKMTTTATSSPTATSAAFANEELVRCYEAASLLVDFGAETRVTSPDMTITIDEVAKISGNTKSGIVVSESSSSLRLSAMVPKAMGSTAGRGYAMHVETFITKERSLLESYAKALHQPSSSTTNASSSDVSKSVLTNGKGLLSSIEEVLSRCARFFPQETVHPVLNTWSRQVATVLVYARKPASDITQSVKAATARGGEEGLGQQPRLKDSISRRGAVEGLLGLYGTIRSLYVLLIAVEARGLKQFISTRSSSSAAAVDAVVEPDVLQEIFKQAEKECINSISVLESSIVSVLLSPLHCAVTSFVKMPALLVGKGATKPVNATGARAAPITAQSTNYSTGDAVYSPVSQSMCDFLLEVPDIVEALAVVMERAASTSSASDDSPSASSQLAGTPSSTIVPTMTTSTLLTSILNETQSTIVHRLCTELVAVHSRQSLEQLAVDLDYITPVLEAVRDEGGAGGVPTSAATGGGDDDAVGGEDSTPAELFDALVKRVRDANDVPPETSTSANLFPFYLIGHAPTNAASTASPQNQKRQ